MVLYGLLSAFALAACATSRSPASSSPLNHLAQEVRQTCEAYSVAVAQRDLAAVRRMWTDDAVFSTAGRSWRSGEEHARFVEGLYRRRPDITLHYGCPTPSVAWTGKVGFAFIDAPWEETWTEAGGPVKMAGRYAAVWTKTSKGWQIASLIMAPVTCRGDTYCPGWVP